MRGVASLAGWQWLFIIEGLITVVLGIIFLLFMPQGPFKPQSVISKKLNYFTEREIFILRSRVILDDPTKDPQVTHKWITRKELTTTVSF